ncbi:MAG TPA: polyisoprenoid-binding protein, partial [Caldithrix sp.]|nr:polyisoprenoid-binding protein [Caldithrix sp.]
MFDENNLDASSLTATIQVASINTGNEKRDTHLRSPDFFDARKYPVITFVSNKIEKAADGYLAHGPLTMKGITREITIPFKI